MSELLDSNRFAKAWISSTSFGTATRRDCGRITTRNSIRSPRPISCCRKCERRIGGWLPVAHGGDAGGELIESLHLECHGVGRFDPNHVLGPGAQTLRCAG